MNKRILLLLLSVALSIADEAMLYNEVCNKECPEHGYSVTMDDTGDKFKINKNNVTEHILALSELGRFLSQNELSLLNKSSFCPVAYSQQLHKLIIVFSQGSSSNKTINLLSYDTKEQEIDTIFYEYGSSLQTFSVSPNGRILSYAVTGHSSACRVSFHMSFIDLEKRTHIRPENPIKLDHNHKDLMHKFYCPEWINKQEIKVRLNYWVCSENNKINFELPREHTFKIETK